MTIGQGFDGVLEAARTGADWAWRKLYDDLAPVVLGYLRGRGASDPEDLTGEVFLQVVRDLGSFDGDEPAFRSWAFTIAHHRLLDDRRRRGRRPETPVEQVPERWVYDPSDAVLGALEVKRMINALSPDQADVVLLRIVGGLTIPEVAKALGKRPGAVKALQRRGLRSLRERGVPL